MTDHRPEEILEKVSSGDRAAAEKLFVAYESYLRMMVRRRISPALRPEFDSMDIVQSVWVDVLKGFREARWQFPDAAHLRAFLVRATLNHFLNRVRHRRKALEHQQALAGDQHDALVPSNDPRPSQIAQADETWQQLLALCPPRHQEILRLKQQGLALADIAHRTGLHEGSVRRILYDLARRYALQKRQTPSPGIKG